MFSDFPGAALRFKMPKPPPKLRDSWGFSRSDPVWRSFQVLSPVPACYWLSPDAKAPHSSRATPLGPARSRNATPISLPCGSLFSYRSSPSAVCRCENKNMQQGGLIARWDRAFVRMKALLDLYRDVVLITKDSKPFPFVSSSF